MSVCVRAHVGVCVCTHRCVFVCEQVLVHMCVCVCVSVCVGVQGQWEEEVEVERSKPKKNKRKLRHMNDMHLVFFNSPSSLFINENIHMCIQVQCLFNIASQMEQA